MISSTILPQNSDPAFFEYLRSLDCSKVRLYGNFSIYPTFFFKKSLLKFHSFS